MIQITFSSGVVHASAQAQTIQQFLQVHEPDLLEHALVAQISNLTNSKKIVDLSYQLTEDTVLIILTADDPLGLDTIRHSTAHLMAYAVKILYPEVQITIGPVIDNGFYYDFSYSRPFNVEDLMAIESLRRSLASKAEPVSYKIVDRTEAKNYFQTSGEHYKVQIIDNIPNNDPISLYQMGTFVDVCRGPHVPNTSFIKHFKLMKVAGAYWRGDVNQPMLQRIYGTAWQSATELSNYLDFLAQAELRDHRKLGKQLDLFHLDEFAPGLVFWHPKGWALWQTIEQYLRQIYIKNSYHEVKAPQIIDKTLWEKTGHWDKYRENMFVTESEKRDYALKPMNCPGHILIFKQGIKSYKELPLRYGEFGQCHRNEPSGGLHGILRVRGFTQDDGHIFCTDQQIIEECVQYTKLVQSVYQDFGFNKIIYKVSTRPEKRIGSDTVWDDAEKALIQSLQLSNCTFEISKGDGAFYGPKIEYTLLDALGRPWQCGTMQVDFFMAQCLGAEYIDQQGNRQAPIMLHRAIVGSLERFIGILIEQYAGAFPTWLAPTQIGILTITEEQTDYALELLNHFQSKSLRAIADCRNEKISYKIREHSLQKYPYLLVIGKKEKSTNTVTVRERGGIDKGSMTIEQFMVMIEQSISSKS